jgi:protoheme IX farnesyltransferase
MKAYSDLTKTGIILFALVSSVAGYAMSFELGRGLEFSEALVLLCGLYFVCAGSFALNQAQEWRSDAKMERTRRRPIPSGYFKPIEVYSLAISFLLFGLIVLYILKPLTAELALLTVVLYNGVYTLICKRYWVFGAVPGAIPGAMPAVIGYSVNSDAIFSPECLYLFLIMFLWQMPHFWCLAIRYRKDYDQGGFPVLPLSLGIPKTLYHIGLYIFAFVGVAMASPWFLKANVLYVILVVPIALKLLYEFFKYYRTGGEQRWLPFFLWTNLSMLVFLGVPVFDKWFFFLWT